jgi:hypothetical protein
MNSEINRPRSWNQTALTGDWLVSLKVDGVRAIWHEEQGWLSRANKPLYNIPAWRQGSARDCEVFPGAVAAIGHAPSRPIGAPRAL